MRKILISVAATVGQWESHSVELRPGAREECGLPRLKLLEGEGRLQIEDFRLQI